MKIAEYIDRKISGITAGMRALDTRLEKLETKINAPKHLEYNEENETKDLLEIAESSENERRKGDE